MREPTGEKKSEFIGVRLLPEQRRKLAALGVKAGHRGSISAGLRWLIDHAEVRGRTVTIVEQPGSERGPA